VGEVSNIVVIYVCSFKIKECNGGFAGGISGEIYAVADWVGIEVIE